MTDHTEHNRSAMMTALRIVAHADGGINEPDGTEFKAALELLVDEGLVRCDKV